MKACKLLPTYVAAAGYACDLCDLRQFTPLCNSVGPMELRFTQKQSKPLIYGWGVQMGKVLPSLFDSYTDVVTQGCNRVRDTKRAWRSRLDSCVRCAMLPDMRLNCLAV